MSQTTSGRQSGSLGRTGRATPRSDQRDTRQTIPLYTCNQGCHGTSMCSHSGARRA